MLKIFERIIKGRQRILEENLKKFGLCPENIKKFGKGYKELYFIVATGKITLKINRDTLDVFNFLKSSDMFVYCTTIDQYVNVEWIRSTRKYFSKRPFRLIIYFVDNTKIKLSNDYQVYPLKYLNDRIRSFKLNEMN